MDGLVRKEKPNCSVFCEGTLYRSLARKVRVGSIPNAYTYVRTTNPLCPSEPKSRTILQCIGKYCTPVGWVVNWQSSAFQWYCRFRYKTMCKSELVTLAILEPRLVQIN
jgi:hypothetical protein